MEMDDGMDQVWRCGDTLGRVGFFYNPDNVYNMLLSVTSAHESKSRSAATEKQTSRDYLAKDITLAVKAG